MPKKVLVTEKLAEAGIERLRQKGLEVDVKLKLSSDELAGVIGAYDALVVRSATNVSAEVIAAGKNLRIIGRAGVGVDNIDVDAATEAGIIVCNAPTSNIVSAAEQTLGLMLACARNTCQANASMHAHEWSRGKFCGSELYEKTLAIFGLGRIGGLVAERARAFGMRLVGYDPYCSPERADQLGVALYDRLEDILPIADFITVHLPKTAETIGMFGPDEFAAMKDGVILVNAARGGIYNMDSLADFVAAGKIGAVGIDVFEEEPCTDSPLHEFPNAVLTPHLGAYTAEAQARAGIQIAEYVTAGLEGSIVPTALNMAPVPPEVMDAVGPYVPACQMMGSMLAQLGGEVPTRLSLTAAGKAAPADPTILVAGVMQGLLSYKNLATVTPVNAEAVARRHGIRVDTGAHASAGAYASSVSVVADGCEIACTLSGEDQHVRLINLLGYKVDIAPGPQALIFEYVDRPGRVGTIGSILGAAGINITTMQIVNNPAEQQAIVYMNVEGDVAASVLDDLRAQLDDLKNLWHVKL